MTIYDMQRLISLSLFILLSPFTISQSNNPSLSMKSGIIVFEGDHDMYFIETEKTDLSALISTGEDTLNAYILHTPDGAHNFKDYLSHTIRFDTMAVHVKQENHLGQLYEEEIKVSTKYGIITYDKRDAYKLKARSKTIFFNNRALIIYLEDYLPIEMFTDKTSTGNQTPTSGASLLMSITIFNKKDIQEAYFPNVYPSISGLYLVIKDSLSKNDTIRCNYQFPFLMMPSEKIETVKRSKDRALNFYYDYITTKTNNRYLLSVPLKFLMSNIDPYFLVIEQFNSNKFICAQKRGNATLTKGIVNCKEIY